MFDILKPKQPQAPEQRGAPLVGAVLAYSEQVLPALLAQGSVTSGLAPWMLGAALASGAEGQVKAELEAALGLSSAEALRELTALLEKGPVPLRSALAFWCAKSIAGQGPLGAWEKTLPVATARGPMPSQAEADAWTSEKTGGLIERFPVQLTPEMLSVLAAAIVAKVRWDEPLDVVDAGPNAWGVPKMLAASPIGVFETSAGLMGAACASSSRDRLVVYSFIGEERASRAELIRAALAYVRAGHVQGHWPSGLPVKKLPRKGQAWTISEGFSDSARVPAFEERVDSADIIALHGVAPAVEAFKALVEKSSPPELRPILPQARMSALARYHRLGFDAAAVAVMGMEAGGVPRPRSTLHLDFSRPHLVLATANDQPWAGLPLFAAWVDKGVRDAED